MKTIKCKACGEEFPATAETRYTARDNSSFINGLVEVTIYDAFDCPHCGCQNIIDKRKRNLDLQLEALASLEEVKCSDCKHFNVGINEEPCCKCTHGTLDLFERKEPKDE